jgi:hypothetical protein
VAVGPVLREPVSGPRLLLNSESTGNVLQVAEKLASRSLRARASIANVRPDSLCKRTGNISAGARTRTDLNRETNTHWPLIRLGRHAFNRRITCAMSSPTTSATRSACAVARCARSLDPVGPDRDTPLWAVDRPRWLVESALVPNGLCSARLGAACAAHPDRIGAASTSPRGRDLGGTRGAGRAVTSP